MRIISTTLNPNLRYSPIAGLVMETWSDTSLPIHVYNKMYWMGYNVEIVRIWQFLFIKKTADSLTISVSSNATAIVPRLTSKSWFSMCSPRIICPTNNTKQQYGVQGKTEKQDNYSFISPSVQATTYDCFQMLGWIKWRLQFVFWYQPIYITGSTSNRILYKMSKYKVWNWATLIPV